MSQNVKNVSRVRIDDGKAMDFIDDQGIDRVEQRRVRMDPYQLLRVLKRRPPRIQLVLLQLLHLRIRIFVIHLQDADEVGDGEHADEPLILGVPEGGGAHPVVHQGEESLLDQELSVEDHQFGRGGDEIVALVETEELDENLMLVFFCERKYDIIRFDPRLERERKKKELVFYRF